MLVFLSADQTNAGDMMLIKICNQLDVFKERLPVFPAR
jgi:hypothetical protein